MSKYEYLKMSGMRVDVLSSSDVSNEISQAINNNNKIKVGNINIHAVNLGNKDERFKKYMNSCEVVFCDGKGIQLGALLQGLKPPEQITYHTYSWELFEHCEKNNYSLFFVGSKPGVAEAAREKILEKNPNIKIEVHHGFFKKDGIENQNVIDKINKFNPNILIVGFGMPLQEYWILDNFEKINTNVFMNGGAYLEWLSGIQKQAPNVFVKSGMEWLYRLVKEPKRLFRRYVIGNPLFVLRIMKDRIFG